MRPLVGKEGKDGERLRSIGTSIGAFASALGVLVAIFTGGIALSGRANPYILQWVGAGCFLAIFGGFITVCIFEARY